MRHRDTVKFPNCRLKTASPGVKGLAGEQGAVVVVADEIRRRRHAAAARRLADDADLHLVLGAPHVQQQDIEHQDGIRRDHAACQTGKRGGDGGVEQNQHIYRG